METASIRHTSYRLYSVMFSLPSRKFTPLLVGRVDSRVPRGALPCTARTSGRPVPMERTSPSAGSRGPLLPRVQLSENSYTRHRLARAAFPRLGGLPAIGDSGPINGLALTDCAVVGSSDEPLIGYGLDVSASRLLARLWSQSLLGILAVTLASGTSARGIVHLPMRVYALSFVDW